MMEYNKVEDENWEQDQAAADEVDAYEAEYQAKMKVAEKLKPAVDALMEKMRCYKVEGPLHGEPEPIYRYCGHKHTGNFVVPWTSQGCSYAIELATIVVAAMDSEVERLRQWKAEATEVIDGLQELGKALDIPLGERVTGTVATEAAKRLRTERDAMREAVTRLGEADQRAIHMYSDSMVKWHARTEAAEAKLRDVEAERDGLRAVLGDATEMADSLIDYSHTLGDEGECTYDGVPADECGVRLIGAVLARSQAPQAPAEQEGRCTCSPDEEGGHDSDCGIWLGHPFPDTTADDKGVQHG